MTTWAKGVNFKNSDNTRNIGGVGIYGTNTTAEKLYIGLGEEPWNNTGLQLTNNAISFKGNKIYHAGDKPTLSDIGAAASSHSHSVLTGINDTRSTEYSPGTVRSDFKVTFQESGTNGVNDGGNFYSLVHLPRWANSTGGYGSQIALTDNENIWYRKGTSDTAWTGWKRIWHSGNFDPNTKFQSGGTYGTLYLTDWFRAKGNTGLYFQDYGGGWYMTDSTWVRSYAGKNIYTDGIMNAKNGFQWNGQSLDSRYAAATHSHSYLPLSGGTLTGAVTFANNTYNIFGDDVALGDCNQAGKIGIKGLNGETGIYFYPQSGNVPQTISINGTGTLTISGTTKGNFNGSLTGNASTATTLQTARSITIGSTSKSFNGSNNVSWSHNEMSVPKTHVNYSFGGNQNAITTAQFVSLLVNAGAFQQNYWISRGSWSYAQNQYITDTGCGNIHLAGCTIEVIGSTSLYTIRIHTPTTSSSGVSNGDFIYINNGTDYSPGWRRIYNNKYKPSLTDIGAASASHNHDSSYVRQVNANGYYGITSNGNTSEWVRTTLNGLIPYQSGGASSLGTSSWPFNDIYANNIYDNGVLLENKFAAASHGNHVPATQAANNAIFLRNDNTWQTIDAWNVNGVRGTQMFEGGNDMNTYNPTRTWSARTFATTSNRPADYCTVFNVGGNASSNFQLAHSYANTSAFYVRGRHDTSGSYTPWARVYTTQYKPSASDIGAAASNHNHDSSYLKSTGGTVSGDILSTGMFTTRAGSADASLRFLNNIASIRYGGTGAGSSNGFNIVGSGDVVKFRVDESGELYARGSQRVYHTGYKPSASDIGAAPTSHNHNSIIHTNEATASITTKDHGNHTWFRNSSGMWTFQSGTSDDDWTQSFQFNLPTAGSAENANWMEIGQQKSNVADGRYRGISLVKLAGSKKVAGDLLVGDILGPDKTAFRLGTDSWLRINDTNSYSSGVYLGTSNVRTDGRFEIVRNNVTWKVTNDNGSFTHYRTTATEGHWFDKNVRVAGEIYVGTNYNQRVYHTGYKPSYSDVGAAAASHTHSNYAPTSHNHTSLTGVNSIAFASHETDAVSMGVLVDGTKSYMDFNLADDFDDMWRWRFKASGSSIFNAMTLQALSSTTSKLTVAGEVAATTFSGNATTATKLQTPKAIKIGNSSKNFDGSGNVTWTLNEIGASASNHTHSNYLSTSGGTLSGAVKFSTATIGASANSNTLQVTGTNDSGMGGIKLGAGGCRIYGKKDAAILFVEGGIFTNDTLQTSDAVIPGAYVNNNSDATNGWARIVRGCTDNVGSVKVQVGGTNTTASFEVVNPSWSTAWFSCGNTGIRSNSYSNFSDERLKTNIEETKKISNKINKIGVYTYNYLSDFDTDISTYSGEARLCENMPEKRWGVIAQEVEELFPELITESKTLIDGENKVVKSVDVYGLTVLTLEFAKEIYKENQSLKEEIKLIKEKLGL